MMPSARSLAPLGSGLTALALVLAFARVAHADECVVDTDCGHGFSCETMIVSGTGGAAGAGGTASGGSAGTTGSGGSTAGTSGSGSGGTGSGAFAPPATGGTGMGAAAGTGSAGTGSGGTGEVPVMPDYCGDGLCQTLSETVETCPEDCSNYKYCAPSACMSVTDCADGYVCAGQTQPGTGGVGGSSGMGTAGTAGTSGTGSGAAAIICGDGFCIAPENATTCPSDCGFTGQCQPQVGVCYSDANCPADYYCELMTTMGTGGGSAMGGTGGTVAAGGSTGGFATGGTAMADPAPGGTSGAGDLVALQGVCMPRNGGAGGTGGTGGTGMGGTGMGGDGQGGACPGGGCGAGGVTTGGTSSGVGGSMAGTSGTGAGTAGTGNAGTGPGSGGSDTGSGGSGTSSGGSGTGASMNGGSGGSSHDVVTHAGCSVSHPRHASSTGAFALFGLALAWALRRRRAQ
jgi:MYXO-CTERM domain-containing protein